MAKKTALQYRAEYILARAFFGLLAVSPRRISIRIGIILARLVFIPLRKVKRVGMHNLSLAFPDLTDAERRRILKRSFNNLGRNLGELSQFNRATPESLAKLVKFDFDDHPDQRSLFETEKSNGRGTIFVGPHLGNWEIGIFAFSALAEPVNYIARRLENPLIEKYIADIRNRFGNRAIDKRNSFQEVLGVLHSGGMVGFMPDVNVQAKDGVFVPFFGTLACTTGGVAMLAMRTNAVLIPLCAVWDAASGKYVVKYELPIEPANTGDREKDILETTAMFTAAIERFIRAAPDQWFWVHKRWKTRPPGEPSLY